MVIMIEYFLSKLMVGKIESAREILEKYPDLTDEIEELGIFNTVSDIIEGRKSHHYAASKIMIEIGVNSKLGKQVGILYSDMKNDNKKSVNIGLSVTSRIAGILNDFKLVGGKKSQLVVACIERTFSDIGEEPEVLKDFVKRWHGKQWRELQDMKKSSTLLNKSGIDDSWVSEEKKEEILKRLEKKEEDKKKRKKRDANKKKTKKKTSKKKSKKAKIKEITDDIGKKALSMEEIKALAKEEGGKEKLKELGLPDIVIDAL